MAQYCVVTVHAHCKKWGVQFTPNCQHTAGVDSHSSLISVHSTLSIGVSLLMPLKLLKIKLKEIPKCGTLLV